MVSPPDGDMAAYVASLEKLAARAPADAIYYPTHGAPIPDPAAHVRALIDHRHAREAQIADCLAAGIDTIPAMVARLYADADARLHPAAARSVLAHLIRMVGEGRATCDGPPTATARYRRG